MAVDNLTIQIVVSNLEDLVDIETFLNLACIVLLLSIVKNLIKLTQA
jgi:hypothetical protein